MRNHESPTAAEERYAQAHAAHYTNDDLLGALRGYGEVLASHPGSPEAGYSRTQILAIVNRVVPAEGLLASNTELALGHLRPGGDRSKAALAS